MLTAETAGTTLNELVNNQKQITATFAALADPTRRRILLEVSNKGETAVTTVAKPFRISLPAISRHLRVLENARLIDRRRQGRVHFIRARPSGLKQAQDWINRCAAAWQFSFDALDSLLEKEPQKQGDL